MPFRIDTSSFKFQAPNAFKMYLIRLPVLGCLISYLLMIQVAAHPVCVDDPLNGFLLMCSRWMLFVSALQEPKAATNVSETLAVVEEVRNSQNILDYIPCSFLLKFRDLAPTV